MKELLISLSAKKERLDKLRPVPPQSIANLEHFYDIELTYPSNAIEGKYAECRGDNAGHRKKG